MKETNKIPFTVICERLSKALGYDFRLSHLAVLMHGWRKKHPDEATEFSTLRMRKKKDGEPWLTTQEAQLLSLYAGYKIV